MTMRADWRTAFAAVGVVGVAAAFTACSDDRQPVAASTPQLQRGGGASSEFVFEPLATSAVCTVAGGNPSAPFVVPPGFVQTALAGEPSYADVPDMNTQNENGPHAGRYLYQVHEVGSNGSLSVIDLESGAAKTIAQQSDWESLDPAVWTPWGTLIFGEETNAAGRRDPRYPAAVGGLVYEVFFSKDDLTVVDSVVARPAIGAKSHEGMRFDRKGNLYSISERNPGYIFKFVPDAKGDLSSGQLYALKVVTPTGDRTGEAEWIALDRGAVQIDASAEGDRVGATGYNRPEDVEIATSTGFNLTGKDVLYVAVTSASGTPVDNRVLGVDLSPDFEQKLGLKAFVYDYVKRGVNATAEFEWPDNLALDHVGNLYITEDPGGSFNNGLGKTKGDDIWMAPAPGEPHAPAKPIQRFASLTDCDAEPTGIYFDLKRDILYVNAQHRGGDRLDKTMAIYQENGH